jgi:ABC-2 type transport system permease protein
LRLWFLLQPWSSFFVKYNLWASIFKEESSSIQGYDLAGMIEYQSLVMIVGLLIGSYNTMKLSEDIRLGRISTYLLYPFGFWQFHAGSFLATQIVQLAVTSFILVCMLGFGWIQGLSAASLALGLSITLLAAFLWFVIQFIFGILAFWLEETWVLRVMFWLVSTFLSGAVIPLELFPPALAKVLSFSPFPYLSFVPVKIFSGGYQGSFLEALLVIALWIVAATVLASAVWRRGLRLYSASGI